MVKTKSIYSPESPDDGLRILVMRYWPRGIKKERASLWLRELGPGTGLIKRWKAGELTWAAFAREYKTEFNIDARKKAFAGLKEIIKKTGSAPVTLLCACPDEETCHRGLLKKMLEKE
ncbi:MAG: DUF488 family protein [Deltaproteobacteria bacterium]|nr:DUF488 family protein [Deltaproteobacteria bacterium]